MKHWLKQHHEKKHKATPCEACGGTGVCPNCGGSGCMSCDYRKVCLVCNGSGDAPVAKGGGR